MRHSLPFPHQFRLLVLALLVAASGTAWADDGAAGDPAFKLTLGSYRFSESGNGVDANLRHTSAIGTTWLGYFDASGLDAHQLRAGWDQTYGDAVRWSPSLQWASGGFVGGSLNVETGQTWFIGAGYGRTNLAPYYNLNFDPNDAWTLSGGYRAPGGASYSLSYTRDDRENPDQQHLHAVYRTPLDGGDRLTLDVLFKRGLVNGESINRVGLTLTYDWPRFFVRLAFDPNTNFTTDDVVRTSIGMRF
jgi:hypothetical protein